MAIVAACALAVISALPALAQQDGVEHPRARPLDPAAVLQQARMKALAGDWQTAEQLLAEVTSGPADFGEGLLEGECLRELMICRIHLSDFQGALDSAFAASKFYEAHSDSAAAAQTMSSLGGLLRAAGRPDLAAEAYVEALDKFALAGDRAGMAGINLSLGIIADMRGDLEGAVARFSEAQEIFRQLGDEESVALCYRNQAYAQIRLGRFDQAVTACQQALFIYNELGLEPLAATTHCELGAAYYELQDYEAAIAECELGLGFWSGSADGLETADCLRVKGLALAALGRSLEALGALDECWELLEEAGQCNAMADLLPAISAVLGSLGRGAETEGYRQRLRRAVAASTASGNPGGY